MKKKIQGLNTDIALYDFICKNEGLNLFQIAKKIEWSLGKVQWAVTRLENLNLIKTELTYNSAKPKRIVKSIKWYEKSDKKDIEVFKEIVSKI